MDSNDSQISLKKETVPIYDYNCLLKFETPLKNTSFGRMLLSTESSSPNPVFGNSDRDTIKKEYLSKELCNSAMKGYFSPGYTADPTDKFSYKNVFYKNI